LENRDEKPDGKEEKRESDPTWQRDFDDLLTRERDLDRRFDSRACTNEENLG
jgi:hypothetical protein